MTKLTVLVVALLAAAGCSKKSGDGEGGATTALAKMSELRDEMCKCKDAACAEGVSEKMTAWNQEQAKSGKAPKMTEADQKRAAELGEAMGTCMQQAIAASAAAPAGSETAAAGSAEAGSAAAGSEPGGLPTECAAYKAQVEKLKTCEKLPPKAKEALVKAFDDAAAGWATLPEAAKAGLSTSCKAGTEAVIAAAKEACGW